MPQPTLLPESHDLDLGFVRRSARYLAQHGLRPDEIRRALCDEFRLSDRELDELLASPHTDLVAA